MGVIYVRPNLINGKKYVGQVTTIRFKERQNKWNNLNQPYAGPAINAARAKYGIEAFGFEILKECNDNELDYWEKYYIKELNTKIPNGYNMTDGGGGTSGYNFSLTEETKKKISEALKGRKLSEEWRKKLSEANKGKIFSEERKKNLSESKKGEKNWNYGKHHTEETRKKISENSINRKDESKPVLQINKDTNDAIAEFPSTREVERQLGFNHSNISACCKGKQKTAYGYIWKYKEESVA